MASPDRDDEWVSLRTFDRQFDADLALSFLHEHSIEARLKGGVGSTASLQHLTIGFRVELLVRASQRGEAEEALVALASAESEVASLHGEPTPDGGAGVYRDAPRGPHDSSSRPPQRYKRAAALLAIAVPIGSGHFYARHNTAGVVHLLGTVLCIVLATALDRPWFGFAAVLVVLSDAFFGALAVDRYNEGRVPSPARQGAFAAVTVLLSMLTAMVTVGAAGPSGRAPASAAHGHTGAR